MPLQETRVAPKGFIYIPGIYFRWKNNTTIILRPNQLNINPWYYINPFPFYPMGYLGFPVLPPLAVTPYLVEPRLRIANAPLTVTIPTVNTTTPPLTAIFNLLDPALLASNIAVLTTNFPTVFDLLVTTFQLPLI